MYTIHLIPFQISGRDFFLNINMSANYNATFMHMPTIKKNPTEQTNVRHSKCKARKRLGAQELKWCVFVLCVVSKDAFQKADDCEKIYMEIS